MSSQIYQTDCILLKTEIAYQRVFKYCYGLRKGKEFKEPWFYRNWFWTVPQFEASAALNCKRLWAFKYPKKLDGHKVKKYNIQDFSMVQLTWKKPCVWSKVNMRNKKTTQRKYRGVEGLVEEWKDTCCHLLS